MMYHLLSPSVLLPCSASDTLGDWVMTLWLDGSHTCLMRRLGTSYLMVIDRSNDVSYLMLLLLLLVVVLAR